MIKAWLLVGLKIKNNISIKMILKALKILVCNNARLIKHKGMPRLSATLAA